MAEVASITNEMLLANHLRSQTEDKDIVAYLIDSQINDFRTTLFRQTMFADGQLDFDAILFVARGSFQGSARSNPRTNDVQGGHFATQYFGFNSLSV